MNSAVMAGLAIQSDWEEKFQVKAGSGSLGYSNRLFAHNNLLKPVSVAAIGYPGDPTRLLEKLRLKELTPQKRRPLEDFVFENKWGHATVWKRKFE